MTPAMRTFVFGAVALGAALGVAGPAAGQSKTGTTIGQTLLLEPSARSAAMGGTGVTSTAEAQALFYNPGAIGLLGESAVQATHMSYLAGVTYDHVASAVRLGGGHTVGLAATYLASGEMDVRTVEQPQGTGERFSVNHLALGAAYAHRITDRFSAGVQATYLREQVYNSALNVVSFNAGVLYRLPGGAHLGASLANFGARGRYDGRDLRIRYDADPDRYGDNSSLPAALVTEAYQLPILFRVGVSYPLAVGPQQRLTLAAEAYQPSDNTNAVSAGAEYAFRDLLFLRAGYDHAFEQDSETGLTAGGGVRTRVSGYGLSFDYAWARHDRLGAMQRFGLGLTF